MIINDEVGTILRAGRTEGNKYYLPPTQLERKMYQAVNKVLDSLGGKWNRKEKAHIFQSDAEELIEKATDNMEYTDSKKEYQFFETPKSLAAELAKMAEIKPGEHVLEPSAGRGRIADAVRYMYNIRCDCIELEKENRTYLKEHGYNLINGENFLDSNTHYDVIIANPPFTKQQDIDHVTHMIKLAKRKVVSIMSNSVLFRENKKTLEFRKMIDDMGGGLYIKLDEKTFKESGTNVNACIMCIDIPREQEPETNQQLSLF